MSTNPLTEARPKTPTLISGTQNYARGNPYSGAGQAALSAWISQITGAQNGQSANQQNTGRQPSNPQNTQAGGSQQGTVITGGGVPGQSAATQQGTVVGGGNAAAPSINNTTPATGTQTDINVSGSGSVTNNSTATQTPAPEASAPVQSVAPNRITADDVKAMYAAMQTQQNNNIDYTVEQAVKQLQRAQQDAQPGFQKQHNQINIDEAQAKDAEVLYAAARGDRGGITARQYNSIMNTAATNRTLVEQQRQQLATDTARQIEDLRAQGEFEKADTVLQIAQQQLAQLWEMQQYEDNLAMNEAQLTGMYKGEQTYEAQEAEKAWAYDIAMQSIKLGIVPDANTLTAAGMNPDEAKLMAYLYGQTQGTSQLIDRYNPSLGAGGGTGSGGFGSGGGGGGGSYSGGGGSSGDGAPEAANVPYDKNVDYQALIKDAVAKGDLVSAALYEQQRNAKIAGENRTEGMTSDYADYLNAFDPDVDYKALRDEAAKNGDMHMAAIYEAQRNAKIDYLKSTGEDVNVRKTNKYEDYLYTATNSKTPSSGGPGDPGSPGNPTPTPQLTEDEVAYELKKWIETDEGGKVVPVQRYDPTTGTFSDKTATTGEIASAAMSYYLQHPNQDANSRTLANWLSEQGYTGEAANLFKGYIQSYGNQ